MISMHYGLLIINDYISISEILSELKIYLDNTVIIITISVVSFNTFLNHFCHLEPFNAVASILIEIKLLSLDPFRKMFIIKKHGYN